MLDWPKIVEGTIVLILMFLVLTNAQGFATVSSSVGTTYVNAVKALQGR